MSRHSGCALNFLASRSTCASGTLPKLKIGFGATTLMLGFHAYPEATPSGETPSGSDAILRNARVQQGCAPTLFEQWAHCFESRGQHMRLYTQAIDIKRQTRRYPTWSGAHTSTPPCSLMSGRRMPSYMQLQLCRYTCSGNRAAMHGAATVPL